MRYCSSVNYYINIFPLLLAQNFVPYQFNALKFFNLFHEFFGCKLITCVCFNQVSCKVSKNISFFNSSIYSFILISSSRHPDRPSYSIKKQHNVFIFYAPYKSLVFRSLCLLFGFLRITNISRFYVAHAGGAFLRFLFMRFTVDGYIEEGLTHINLRSGRFTLSRTLLGFSDFAFDNEFITLPSLSLDHFISSISFVEIPDFHYSRSSLAVIQSRGITAPHWHQICSSNKDVFCFLHPVVTKNCDVPESVNQILPPPFGIEPYFRQLLCFESVIFGSTISALFFAYYLSTLSISTVLQPKIICILTPDYSLLRESFLKLDLADNVVFVDQDSTLLPLV